MSDRQEKDKKRFVQQYVNQQRAYLPTYTAEQLFNKSYQLEPHPKQTTRGDGGFGFDTPVLRPRRVRANRHTQSPPKVEQRKSLREHEAERVSPEEEPSESDTRNLALGNNKKRSKPKEPSTPIGDTDDERAARLADRRERKRKKRAIVDDLIVSTTASKKGKANNQKKKKPAGLALLYGFSATNVTKDRLTLRPAPTLGVFSKGKASAKKKVAAARKPLARNMSFSETAFLNKSTEQVADSDDSLAPDQSISQEKTKCTKKDGQCTEDGLKTPQEPTRTIAESEIWDIELQSKLPSSVCDIASEFGATNSAPVVLDVRGVEWSASLNKVGGGRNKTRTPKLHSLPRHRYVDPGSPLVRDEGQSADASTIHPSHSASQVGCLIADSQPHPVVPSKYFAIPKPIPAQEYPSHAPQLSKSDDKPKTPNLRQGTPLYSLPVLVQGLAANAAQLSKSNMDDLRSQTSMYFPEELEPASVMNNLQSPRSNYDISVLGLKIPDRGANPMVDLQTDRGAASPVNSLTSAFQPMVNFQTPYDMVVLDCVSSPYEDYYGGVDTPQELPGGRDLGHFERSECGLEQDLECHEPHQDDTLGYWYRSSGGLTTYYDVDFEDTYDDTDPLAPEQADEPRSIAQACFYEAPDDGDGEWFQMDETEQDYAGHEDETAESMYYNENFLEGRALLLGVTLEQEERQLSHVGVTALVRAEMDVAYRLRDHWRPLRL